MKNFFPICILSTLLIGCGGSGGSDGGDGAVAPQNRAPIAVAGNNLSTDLGQSVNLSGAASSDPDGDSLTYSWSISSSPGNSNPIISSGSQVEANFTADTAGSYEIELTVSDGSISSSDTITITVTGASNPSLVANAGSGYSASEGFQIQLDGSASTAADNSSLTYSWKIVSAPSSSTTMLVDANSATPTLESTSVGSYEVELTVTSDDGSTATDIATVLVLDYLPIMTKAENYTQILPADDTRIIYVSSQTGDDANDGLSSETPVQTIQHGASLLRDGFPDWLALKAGDTWETGIGGWRKSGRSADEPMVITSYGSGDARPLLRTHDQDALRYQGGSGSPAYVDYLVIHGLHFFAASREPGSPDFTSETSNSTGIVWLRGTNSLLIEDNMFQYFTTAIVLQETGDIDIKNVLIKNNVITDSYGVGSHSQGIYIQSTDNVRIERNVFDHVGWNEQIEGANKTKFNHSIYVQSSNRGVEIVDNIIARSSSHGIQLRPGGLMQGNVLVENAISLMLGGDSMEGEPGIIQDNVILHGSDLSDEEYRGWGIDLTANIVSAEVRNNIVAHENSMASDPRAIKEHTLSTESGNAIYEWGSQSQSEEIFVNPSITIADLDLQAGGSGTLESFYENIRKKSLRDPSTHSESKYDVDYIRHYFQDGFKIAQ
ncbi:PKD domain-containing protein [Microbulbifer bruguierae]|uniref:PKD domain-containing protein n=1 Tax=Microbulbifer bruguierae TaxID=3029061 RepID=A0ABY8NAY7_9GAMM|nr:right-handed parallel beta-helix repeat-containing protein [Microbulbifer bruguierae]WGL15247.1 PKD domain-containing protein [Microbulbifer bruguierae]